MRYITLDTGVNGAMVLFEMFEPVEALPFTRMGRGINPFEVDHYMKKWEADRIFIESITPRPYQGAKSTATQFLVIGQCHTLAQLNHQTVEYIFPQTWSSFTKRLSKDPTQKQKKIAQELAKRFFSDFCKPWTNRSNNIHDGIADCLGIHMYIERDTYVDYVGESQ